MKRQANIIVSSQDLDRLETLLDSEPGRAAPGRTALLAELDRADVVAPQDIPSTVVTMNSQVHFAIADTGEEFCFRLVYPKDANGDADRISVLAPVGSALLGLSVGDELDWPRPDGGMMRVRVLDIPYQPERAGEFHR